MGGKGSGLTTIYNWSAIAADMTMQQARHAAKTIWKGIERIPTRTAVYMWNEKQKLKHPEHKGVLQNIQKRGGQTIFKWELLNRVDRVFTIDEIRYLVAVQKLNGLWVYPTEKTIKSHCQRYNIPYTKIKKEIFRVNGKYAKKPQTI